MSKKTKIKLSSYKNKKGQTVACTRVYSSSGELLSEHEAVGSNAQQASSAALHKMGEVYKELGGDYDVSSAKIEYESSKKPISPEEAREELDKLVDKIRKESELQKEETNTTTPQTPTPQPKFVKGRNGTKHLNWREYDEEGKNGEGHTSLSEPVPSYFVRTGDLIINATTMKRGVDNNTHIVLGRDRNSIGEYNSSDKKRSQSGYSNHMGAGAIDIVVGRGAPFPVATKEFGPMFTTFTGEKAKAAFRDITLSGTKPEGIEAPHPGYAMDAARIYISQMTDVDENFKITKRIRKNSDLKTRAPASAIVIKADKLRMHARGDIKIVTAGDIEPYMSTGARNDSTGGIHLIAGNGDKGLQQPIPRGKSLESALTKIIDTHNSLVDILFGFVKLQMSFNKELATHFHQSPLMGASTTPSITGWALGVETQVSHFRNFIMEIPKHVVNTENIKKKYLTSGEEEYINSMFNTTN